MSHAKITVDLSEQHYKLLERFAPDELEVSKNLTQVIDRILIETLQGQLFRIAEHTGLTPEQVHYSALKTGIEQLKTEHGLSSEQIRPKRMSYGSTSITADDGFDLSEFGLE